MVSTAGDATLSVADPSTAAPGHLVNGAFSLPQALQASGSTGRHLRCASGHAEDVQRAGLQRPGDDQLQAADRVHGRAAYRHLRQDADVHAVDHHAVDGQRALRVAQGPPKSIYTHIFLT